MQRLRLQLRNEWGSLQRVLGLLTRKRVGIDGVNAERTSEGWSVLLGIEAASPNVRHLVDYLRKMPNVVSAELEQELVPVLTGVAAQRRPPG